MHLHIVFTKEDAAIQRPWGCRWGFFSAFISPTPLLQTVLLSQNLPASFALCRAVLQGARKGAGKEETWTFYFAVVDSMAGLLQRVMAC